MGAEGADEKRNARWEPDRWVIDGMTAKHPCLLSSFDSELYLANTAALQAQGLIMETHGALFFKPYDDQPGNYGHYRPHTSTDSRMLEGDMEKMYGLIMAGV